MPRSETYKIISSLAVLTGGSIGGCIYMALVGDEKFYERVLMPQMRSIDAETAHKLAVSLASWGLTPRSWCREPPSKRLVTRVFGIDFENPIGLAAGFDKDGRALGGMFRMGFGFVEVGSVTPLPQPGNDKPRVFRLLPDEAVINRYGFNSDGSSEVIKRIREFRETLLALRIRKLESKLDYETPETRNQLNINFFSPDMFTFGLQQKITGPPHDRCVLAVNLGKNKISEDAVADYTKGIEVFGDFSDFIVVNLSSPNTPGLRSLQSEEHLDNLLKGIDEYLSKKSSSISHRPKILVKLAPDLSESELKGVARIALKWHPNVVTGLIMGNTSISRPVSLKSPPELVKETGGLSGKPITEMSTRQVARLYKLTGGRLPIVGVGGVSSGRDAYEKITAGASLVELYTALIYQGPPVVNRIKRELDAELAANGYNNVAEAVGKRADEFSK